MEKQIIMEQMELLTIQMQTLTLILLLSVEKLQS